MRVSCDTLSEHGNSELMPVITSLMRSLGPRSCQAEQVMNGKSLRATCRRRQLSMVCRHKDPTTLPHVRPTCGKLLVLHKPPTFGELLVLHYTNPVPARQPWHHGESFAFLALPTFCQPLPVTAKPSACHTSGPRRPNLSESIRTHGDFRKMVRRGSANLPS